MFCCRVILRSLPMRRAVVVRRELFTRLDQSSAHTEMFLVQFRHARSGLCYFRTLLLCQRIVAAVVWNLYQSSYEAVMVAMLLRHRYEVLDLRIRDVRCEQYARFPGSVGQSYVN